MRWKVREKSMRNYKKWLMAFLVASGVLSSTTMTAFAFVGGEAQAETAPVETTETVIPEQTETAEQTEGETGTSFSIPGNGDVLDDMKEDSTKEFLTIQTKNGNTFFLVLDRSSNTENVYMLSMVDENDLAEFIDGETQTEPVEVVIPEEETIPEQTEPETEPEEESDKAGGTSAGALLAIGILAAGGIGAGYYFKVLKPKKDETDEDGEDLEFYDDGVSINEDEEEMGEDE